jgi:hypothetical protein
MKTPQILALKKQAQEQRERLPSYHPWQKLSESALISELMYLENQRIKAEREKMESDKSHFYFND